MPGEVGIWIEMARWIWGQATVDFFYYVFDRLVQTTGHDTTTRSDVVPIFGRLVGWITLGWIPVPKVE